MMKEIAAAERKVIGAIFSNCDQQGVIAKDIDAFIHLGNREVRKHRPSVPGCTARPEQLRMSDP
jgi:hypothetical protein